MRGIDPKYFKKAMIEADCDTFIKLEEKTGIDRASLSKYAKNETKPTYDSLVKLIEAFHLRYDEIGRAFFYNENIHE